LVSIPDISIHPQFSLALLKRAQERRRVLMFRSLKFAAIALATLLVVEPAIAQYQTNNRAPIILRKLKPPVIKPNLSLLPEVRIMPSQAAAIAQGQVPYSKVVKVKLLPRGDYAVTLVADGNVTRVIVNGQDGSVN
jgi:hypothetical protein